MSELQAQPPGRHVAYYVSAEAVRRRAAAGDRSWLARFFGVRPIDGEDANWYRGALGELHVGQLLGALGDEWRVLHSLQFAGRPTDLDHLLIGPSGVYTVNTKNHAAQRVWIGASTVLVNGQKPDRSYIHAAEREADRIDRELRRLKVPVLMTTTPLVVLVDPAAVTVKQRPERVRLLRSRELVRWLRARRVLLSAAQVRWLADALGRSSMWAPGPADAESVRCDFDELDREVRSARRTRRVWAVSGMAAAVLAMLLVLPRLPAFIAELLV